MDEEYDDDDEAAPATITSSGPVVPADPKAVR
jgi:hypothetical protein